MSLFTNYLKRKYLFLERIGLNFVRVKFTGASNILPLIFLAQSSIPKTAPKIFFDLKEKYLIFINRGEFTVTDVMFTTCAVFF
jgi:hypothetical protein